MLWLISLGRLRLCRAIGYCVGVGLMVRDGAEAVPATAPVSTKIAVLTLFAPRADANRRAGFQVLTVTVDRDGEGNYSACPAGSAGRLSLTNERRRVPEGHEALALPLIRGEYPPGVRSELSMAFTFGNRDIVARSYVDRWHLLGPWE